MTRLIIFSVALFALHTVPAWSKELKKTDLEDIADKMNYTVGYEIGEAVKRIELPVERDIFWRGVTDGMAASDSLGTSLLTRAERTDASGTFLRAARESQHEKRQAESVKNRKAADAFLKKNRRKPGVISTASGLQYKVLRRGKGPKPGINDKVSVHYVGTKMDGTAFDSSYQRGKPDDFGVSQVVKGWTEALQQMRVGAKWIVYIPPELGYGDRGAGEMVEPNALMIFEIELLDIVSEQRDGTADTATGDEAIEAQNEINDLGSIIPQGVYEGMGYQNDGSSWSIQITVGSDFVRVEYPSLDCGGTLTLKSVDWDHVDFFENITFGDNCINNGVTSLWKTPLSNKFDYAWNSAEGIPGAVGKVTLRAAHPK